MVAICMCGGAQRALSPLPRCHNHRGVCTPTPATPPRQIAEVEAAVGGILLYV
jgi:hypothetical protein